MYFEVFALSRTSAAATEVHSGRNNLPTTVFSAGNTLTNSSKENVPTKRGVAGLIADENPIRKADAAATRRGRSTAVPLGVDRHAGADVDFEGVILERTLHFHASADR